MSKRYIIKEKWRVMFQNEYYENEVDTLKQVKKYIKEWIENWKENAKDVESKVVLAKTDFITFAKVHIVTDEKHEIFGKCKDTFNLKVIDIKGKPKKIYNLIKN